MQIKLFLVMWSHALRSAQLAARRASSQLTALDDNLFKGWRSLKCGVPVLHGSEFDPNAPSIGVTFVEKDGQERHVRANIGQSLLELAHVNDIDLEGACEGSLACSTCHVILEDREFYDKLEEPDDDENDMLDLAFGLTETSRLGCQVKASEDLDGLKVKIPSASRNIGKEVA